MRWFWTSLPYCPCLSPPRVEAETLPDGTYDPCALPVRSCRQENQVKLD